MMIHSRGYILLLKKSIPYRLEAGPTSVPYESPMVGQLYPHILDFSFTRLIVEDMLFPRLEFLWRSINIMRRSTSIFMRAP